MIEIINLYQGKDCFNFAKPIEGAVKALNEMLEEGHDMYICTTPVSKYQYCVHDKYYWVEKNLGKEWVKRLILTPDKTFVHADLLIDDKPNITGAQSPPMWKHILFTRQYNLDVCGKPRIDDWSCWRDIVSQI